LIFDEASTKAQVLQGPVTEWKRSQKSKAPALPAIQPGGCRISLTALIPSDLHVSNLPAITFHGNLKGAAADFAVRGKGLMFNAGVQTQIKALAAKRTLDGREGFHV
jgi:hypothetical protein